MLAAAAPPENPRGSAVAFAHARAARRVVSVLRLAEEVGYRSAGTLEYLFDDARGEFYFIEMNTRIQSSIR